MHSIDFHPLDRSDEAALLPYLREAGFGDVTFRTLYAWQPIISYSLGFAAGCPVVTGVSADGIRSYMLYRHSDTPPDNALCLLLRHVSEAGEPELLLEYVREDELPAYRAAAERLGLPLTITFDERFSDYLYLREDFLSLDGRSKKSLRGDERALLRRFPGLRVIPYQPELLPVCLSLFDGWCSGRACSACVNGCEKLALSRFLSVYEPGHSFGYLCYDGDTPLSFLIGEQLGGPVYDHHFQKNPQRIRGLMAYLGRYAASEQPAGSYLDLEEDMGLDGIRREKEELHPCAKAHKYTLSFPVPARTAAEQQDSNTDSPAYIAS